MKKLMRFIVSATPLASTGWLLALTCPAIQPEPLCPARVVRLLRDPDDPARSFPLPPVEEVEAMDSGLPYYKLCSASDPGELYAVYERLWNRDLLDQDVIAFGGYLFATLLGASGWQALRTSAGDAAIELALCWPTSEWMLSRLPWELMSDAAQQFLAMYQWPVAITRLVPETANGASKVRQITLEQPLKVLFVIGSAEDDPRIRPGAESLGLLQRLGGRGKDLSLNAHILVRASTQDIEDELKSFQPSVVHFICHGTLENTNGSIELLSDDKTKKITLGAAELYGILARSMPDKSPIVVLNACYTASIAAPEVGRAAQENVSLAAELVARGVPMVIAMGGEIADHACRMFTWRFYETLLEGGCVINATAEGRWVGITHLGGATRSIDWASPTLFMGDHVSSDIRVEVNEAALKRERIARDFLSNNNNPAFFCDRLDIVEKDYKQLMKFGPDSTKGVLAIEAQQFVDAEQPYKRMRHGRSRLLCELAARAVRDGHIPCLVHFNGPRPRQNQEKGPPTTFQELIVALLDAIYKTWTLFELPKAPGDRLLRLLEETLSIPTAQQTDDDLEDDEVRDAYRTRVSVVNGTLRKQADQPALYLDSEQVRIRLRKDLWTLALAVRQQYPDAPSAAPLVLIDDIHGFDAAAGDLLALLSRYGFGSSRMTIPVILSFFSAQRDQPEYSGAMRSIHTFLTTNKQFVRHAVLKPFATEENERGMAPYLPYQQYLLHYYRVPLIFGSRGSRSERALSKMKFFHGLHKKIRGMPSRLTHEEANDDVEGYIDSALDLGHLEEANNEAILNAALTGPGGTGA